MATHILHSENTKATHYSPVLIPRPIKELYWAAGFIEGEGSFYHKNGSVRLTAAQVDKEPIERLLDLFGGTVWLKSPLGHGSKQIWTWFLPHALSVQAMMTLYPLMSARRQEKIRECLSVWRSARNVRQRGALVCLRGHSLIGHNGAPRGNGIRCRECSNSRKREARAKRTKAA